MKGFRMRRCAGARVLLWCSVAGLPAASHAGTLHLVPATSHVQYHIDHSVKGVTNDAGPVSGLAETDSAGCLQSGVVEVDLRGLQTGIGMRDRHVKGEDCLDVAHFPTARFTLQPPPAPAAADSLLANGTMELHGQTHELQVPLLVTREGPGLWLQGRFTFVLADWGIKRPKRFGLAAGKTVDVRLDLHFAP